jgi:hypothetical protein
MRFGQGLLLQWYQGCLFALNRAPSVNLEVAMPVVPRNSISVKPAVLIMSMRSRTGTAPPTQSDHASRLPATFSGRSPFKTISAN